MRSKRSRASHSCPLPERPSFDRASLERDGGASFRWLCRPASYCCSRCGRGWVWGRRVVDGGTAAGWVRASEVDSRYLRRAWRHDWDASRLPLFSRERRRLRREARTCRFFAAWAGDVA